MPPRLRSGLTVVILVAGGLSCGDPNQRAPQAHPSAGHRETSAAIGSVQDAAFADGSWYVADARNSQVVVLDASGMLARTIGRRGSGPGEFALPRSVAVAAGRLFVSELGRPGVSEFDTSGAFLARISERGRCGMVVQLAATRASLFAIRRCFLPDRRFVMWLDSLAGDRLVPWTVIDTLGGSGVNGVSLSVPLIAADADDVVVGDGTRACVTRLRIHDSAVAGRRCLTDITPLPTPDSIIRKLNTSTRGRVRVPKTLPRVLRLSLVRGRILALVPDDDSRATWRSYAWEPGAGSATGTPAGRQATGVSYLTQGGQLTVTETPDGLVIAVAPAVSQ